MRSDVDEGAKEREEQERQRSKRDSKARERGE